ncbi:hypothetical protein HPB48_014986 [Haemaphysalis longicornis]|uniref:Uncharacterized protein n=1 Tax=Haemaphysalis longicornis TaxID=44386 RepID=A0A9J6FGX2_HAELO|nr:hypothetical protein HPB48_014986 [Haemaphysalis longicornis]
MHALTQSEKLLGKDGSLITHVKSYHLAAVSSGKEFLQRISAPQRSTESQLNAHRLSQVKENRRTRVPVINAIIFPGRQNIYLQGHSDDGAPLKDCGMNERRNFQGAFTFSD